VLIPHKYVTTYVVAPQENQPDNQTPEKFASLMVEFFVSGIAFGWAVDLNSGEPASSEEADRAA
jgi:hypothetical protein